jgi:hypothetical protein
MSNSRHGQIREKVPWAEARVPPRQTLGAPVFTAAPLLVEAGLYAGCRALSNPFCHFLATTKKARKSATRTPNRGLKTGASFESPRIFFAKIAEPVPEHADRGRRSRNEYWIPVI